MADSRLIPAGILDASSEAFNEVIERMGTTNHAPVLVLDFDNTPADALFWLADQFHLNGVEGWRFADTEAKKRALVKAFWNNHRFKGTPGQMKAVILAVLGFEATIYEGFDFPYDGSTARHDGQRLYDPYAFALFDVEVWNPDAGITEVKNPDQFSYDGSTALHDGSRRYGIPLWRYMLDADDVRAMAETLKELIGEYKNARSLLRRLVTPVEWIRGMRYDLTTSHDGHYRYDLPHPVYETL